MVWDIHRIHSLSPDPPDPPDPVSSTAARDPPTTRAGGQDDGSYTKLPQIKYPRKTDVNFSFILDFVGGLGAQKLYTYSVLGGRTQGDFIDLHGFEDLLSHGILILHRDFMGLICQSMALLS